MPPKNPWQYDVNPLDNKGLDVIHPVEQVTKGFYSRMEDVKSLQEGTITPRPGTSLLNSVAFASQAPVITAQGVLTGGDGTNTDTYASGTFDFQPNRLYIVATSAFSNTGGEITNTTLSGAGMTWTKIGRVAYHVISAPLCDITLWRGMRTSGSQVDALTWVYDVQADVSRMSCTEFLGMDTGGTEGSAAIVQAVSYVDDATETPNVITMSAFSGGQNATYGAFGLRRIDGSFTPGSGFTEIHDIAGSGLKVSMHTLWKNVNDLTIESTHSAGIANAGGFGIEIKAP